MFAEPEHEFLYLRILYGFFISSRENFKIFYGIMKNNQIEFIHYSIQAICTYDVWCSQILYELLKNGDIENKK